MAIIDRVRTAVGRTSKAYDDDLLDVIEAARADMIDTGVPVAVARSEDNRLVTQALKCYAKAQEAWEEPSIAQAQMESYQAIVNKLSLTHRNGEESCEAQM